ncbi:MAG: hypothetical protein H7255_03120 [Ramlibacter sp.]|nr:hypothetical protein [Ramlibacter sp.]
MASPQLIVFAIQSAVRLANQARMAYVDSTRNREITLPLVNFVPVDRRDAQAAILYFQQNRPLDPARLVALWVRVEQDAALSADEKDELNDFYEEAQVVATAGVPGFAKSQDEYLSRNALLALTTVRQWNRDPNPSALQRIAGTLINLGVEYFAMGPGAARMSTEHSEVLKALLEGLENVDFATDKIGDLPEKLFTIAMDAVSAHPEIFSSNNNIQKLITATTSGLVKDVNERIAAIRAGGGSNSLKEQNIRSWGEIVFRSIVSSAGEVVLKEPQRFLGVNAGAEAELVQSVGQTLLALVVDDNPNNVFTRENLTALSASALRVVAEHPELVTGDGRFKGLVADVAAGLGNLEGMSESPVLPLVLNLILEKTAENLPLLWPRGAADGHLAFGVAQSVLGVMMKSQAANVKGWKLEFRREDVLTIVDAAVDSLLRNPGWLVRDKKLSPVLQATLTQIVAVIRAKGDARLSAASAAQIVLSGLAAAAMRVEFIQEIEGKPLVAKAIEIVLDTALGTQDEAVVWRMVREEVLLELVDTALEELADSKLNLNRIVTLKAVLDTQVESIRKGDIWSVAVFAVQLAENMAVEQ